MMTESEPSTPFLFLPGLGLCQHLCWWLLNFELPQKHLELSIMHIAMLHSQAIYLLGLDGA